MINFLGESFQVEGSKTALEHGCTVYSQLVSPRDFKNVGIVAHSFGGNVTQNIVKNCNTPNLKVICFTDSQNLEYVDRTPPLRNWLRSELPLDTIIIAYPNENAENISAGPITHEMSSAVVIDSVFEFIQKKFT